MTKLKTKKDDSETSIENLDCICEDCLNESDQVLSNLVMYGYKICESCRISKTIFPI